MSVALPRLADLTVFLDRHGAAMSVMIPAFPKPVSIAVMAPMMISIMISVTDADANAVDADPNVGLRQPDRIVGSARQGRQRR
jgi:hypothetical protein